MYNFSHFDISEINVSLRVDVHQPLTAHAHENLQSENHHLGKKNLKDDDGAIF